MTSPDGTGGFEHPPTRESIAATIAESEAGWTVPEAPVNLPNGLRWRPDLEIPASGAVLHVQLTDRLPPHIAERLRYAAHGGKIVHVAVPAEALWNLEVLHCLSETDARVHLLNGDYIPQEQAPLLTTLAAAEIRLPLETRIVLGGAAWERCRTTTTADEKGRGLESLLVFLLGQSRELRVVETRLRTETEEIDIVAQARVAGLARCWALPGSPFVLLEAKNWSERVGKSAVSDMLTKLRGYRGTTKVGILVGACGFTQDALQHELRFATEDGTIVFVGPEQLQAWIEAEALDEHFEDLVRRAMLR